MTTITLPMKLAERLYAVARRQQRGLEECALAALTAYVEECEESARLSQRLNGRDLVVRLPDGFYD